MHTAVETVRSEHGQHTAMQAGLCDHGLHTAVKAKSDEHGYNRSPCYVGFNHILPITKRILRLLKKRHMGYFLA